MLLVLPRLFWRVRQLSNRHLSMSVLWRKYRCHGAHEVSLLGPRELWAEYPDLQGENRSSVREACMCPQKMVDLTFVQGTESWNDGTVALLEEPDDVVAFDQGYVVGAAFHSLMRDPADENNV